MIEYWFMQAIFKLLILHWFQQSQRYKYVKKEIKQKVWDILIRFPPYKISLITYIII